MTVPPAGGWPDGEPADLAPGGYVPLEERRRQGQGSGVVVEAEAVRSVRGNPLADVDLQIEQIANDVAVLGLVEAVKRLGATWIRLGFGGPIQLVLEPPPESVIRRLVGPRTRLRRHGADPQLPHHALPDLGILGDVVDVDGIERQPHRAQLRHEPRLRLAGTVHERAVVARDAIPVDQRPLRRDRRRRLRPGLPRGLHTLRGAHQRREDRHAQSAEKT